MGQPDKAITYHKKMLELQPDNINLTYNLALLYNEINQPEQALELLNKLIIINPKKADFYIARANFMLNKENYPAAKADFDRAISVDPGNYNTYRARSYYYMNYFLP